MFEILRLTLFLSVFLVTGASQAVCPVPLIVAAEGDNVTLQCHLDPEVNAVDHAIDWEKDDVLRVYVRRHREPNEADQRPEYRNRTRDDPEGLKRGNLSLVLYSVKQSDSGSYRCFDATMNSFCYLNLTVEAKDPKNQTKRLDSTTTVPPTEDPGAEKKTDGGTSVGLLVGVLVAVVVLLAAAFLLGRCNLIDICKNVGGRGENNNYG